jgi:hypothetical protein
MPITHNMLSGQNKDPAIPFKIILQEAPGLDVPLDVGKRKGLLV